MKIIQKYLLFVAMGATAVLSSCDKVSPLGVLMAGTAVEDRVKMSHLYFLDYKFEYQLYLSEDDEYTFLLGSDSHLTTDPGRLDEMIDNSIENDDVMMVHLGDIADTKPEYYICLDSLLQEGKRRWVKKNYDVDADGMYYRKTQDVQERIPVEYEYIKFPFYPVVGNHDITHNGWAMWSNIFHSSFYEMDMLVPDINEDGTTNTVAIDRFIFLDTANGTMGAAQVNYIEQGTVDGMNGYHYRNTFVFSHTNIFRPSSFQFASTFPREETFFLLNQFAKWNATAVFCGHVHAWDDRTFEGVRYITLTSMSERNSPKPGDYLVRVHVKKDGEVSYEKVHMNYVKKKK